MSEIIIKASHFAREGHCAWCGIGDNSVDILGTKVCVNCGIDFDKKVNEYYNKEYCQNGGFADNH